MGRGERHPAGKCGGRFDALPKRNQGADVYHAVQAGKETENGIKNPCVFTGHKVKSEKKGRDTMDDQEKIQSFGDMVEATEKLTKPWRLALLVTNVLWAFIVGMLVWFAYMTPIDVDQSQDFTEQVQTQTYTAGVTDGN